MDAPLSTISGPSLMMKIPLERLTKAPLVSFSPPQ
jgi:hypothetical protein